MTKFIIGIVAVIIVLGGALYFLETKTPTQTSHQTGTQGAQQTASATSTYTGANFSVVYPNGFTVDPAFQNTEVSDTKPISGVKFTIPGTMATGTTLAADTFISVEQLPHAKSCTGDIYLKDNVTPTDMTDSNGITYSVATSSGAATGNFYEEQVYAIKGSSPCTAVRYFIHSTDINNYPAGSVQAFDRTQLLNTFDGIRRSVTLNASAANAATSSSDASTTMVQ